MWKAELLRKADIGRKPKIWRKTEIWRKAEVGRNAEIGSKSEIGRNTSDIWAFGNYWSCSRFCLVLKYNLNKSGDFFV